jgi:chemotaxis protein methyltransferase CheR
MEIGFFSDSDLKIVADLVYDTCGIVFRESNLTVLVSRLTSKLKEKQVGARDYISLLQKDNRELLSFIDFVTTNFTSFFRNPRQFEILAETVLPEVIKRNADSKFIKVWSAGCSTGEEPFTIAMVLHEYLESKGLTNAGWTFLVSASDISLESLFTAKEGKFPKKSVEKIERKYLDKYFTIVNQDYIVKDVIKKNVHFDYHNLIYDNGIRGVDIVFCRNVLIYFDTDVQRKVLYNIFISAKPESFLFIGHSESLIGIFDGYKPETSEKGILYVRQ